MVARPVSLRQEVTELLQELIRLDTVNPPGNETRAAEALERYLARNGVAPRHHVRPVGCLREAAPST